MNWLDEYEIRARIIPSVIILLPLMIPLYLIIQDHMVNIVSIFFSGTIFLSILYTISFFVRKNGSNIEKKMWTKWGVPPSIRILRWDDNTFSSNTKNQLYEAIRYYCHIDIAEKENEQSDLFTTDTKIQDAFGQVKSLLYHDDANGIWKKFNAEYGFNRNLLGSKWYWILSALTGEIICWIIWYYKANLYYLYGFFIDIFLFFIALFWTTYLLPLFVQDSANRYAMSVWHSFLVIMKKDYMQR